MFVDPVPDPWRSHLEARWQDYRDEMRALAAERWIPWAPQQHNYAVGASILPLWMKYQPPWLRADFTAHRAWCAHAARLPAELPGVYTVCFSRMSPGARVAPHSDFDEPGFLRIHLGLDTDAKARFRCGAKWTTWHAGRCFAFHAATEHEVVHDGDVPRVALLLDVDAASLAKHRVP